MATFLDHLKKGVIYSQKIRVVGDVHPTFCQNSLLVITRILASINQRTNPNKPPNRWREGLVLTPAADSCYDAWDAKKIQLNGWLIYGCFIMENPIKMDDLGVPLFLETPLSNASNQVLPCFFMRITQYRNSHSGNANYPTSIIRTG